jgi:hypothetical protein
MSIAEPPKSPRIIRPGRNPRNTGLQVSAYDQVAGLLVAVLVIFGFVVGLMFLIWFSSRLWWPKAPIPVMVLEDVGGGGSGSGSGEESQQFEEPAPEELVEVTEPKIEDVLIALQETPQVPELTISDPNSSQGTGQGTGQGDGTGSGPGGPGTSDGIPAWERWEVRLNANTIDDYAKQLDFFKIELAVAGGGSPLVTYVSNVSGTPKVRTGNPKDEKRLRFMHRSGALRDADRNLVSKAKVDANGKVIFQFYSEETYKNLLTLENIAMKPRRISEVRRTVFGVRGSPGKYEFFVISQDYL